MDSEMEWLLLGVGVLEADPEDGDEVDSALRVTVCDAAKEEDAEATGGVDEDEVGSAAMLVIVGVDKGEGVAGFEADRVTVGTTDKETVLVKVSVELAVVLAVADGCWSDADGVAEAGALPLADGAQYP